MTSISPAEIAIDLAISETGLEVDSREFPRLVRRVARALSPGQERIEHSEFIQALCVVRRKGWVSRLMDLTRRSGEIWVSRTDMEEAALGVTDPIAGDDALRAALADITAKRLRDAGATPPQALEAIRSDVLDTGKVLSSGQVAVLAKQIASAFGRDDGSDFIEEAARDEAARADNQAQIEQTARTRRREEVRRLRDWETSLVRFQEVPRLLHCSHREALRWIAENRLPVARRIPNKDGTETWEFDPAELKALRPQIALWREGASAPRTAPDEGNRKIGNAVIARVAALDRYAAHFKTARALQRRITLVTGPTNSGKSHTALDALARSDSGLALAPLRLLAHEFRESLLARGVEASLATGEERITMPGSRHLAATVEMCPFHNPVDVAIIDEAQMLGDTDRGAAWTAAIMGAPARHLYVLGAPDCIPMVRRIAELCGDPLDEVSLSRKSALTAASDTVKLSDLRSGDALIAFSRREVLDLRADLMALGRRVAVVYGALSPEVRRAEANRFNTGQADILIATDAIGMGLNLSIRRIVFASLRKFDGTQTRDLTSQEVKQIGGRAGRFGKHEEGIVAVLHGAGSPSFIKAMLSKAPEVQTDLRPLVQPDADIVRAVAAEIGTESLFGVLARIRRAVLRRDDPNYRLADMEQAFAIASSLEGVEGLDLTQRWTYAMCPVDDRDNGIQRLVNWAADHAAGRHVHPPGTGRLPAPANAGREELERAEKRHKRLVAWRWLALRFPDIYPAHDEAEEATATLNTWIEDVLRQQSRTRGAEPTRGSRKPASKGSDRAHRKPGARK